MGNISLRVPSTKQQKIYSNWLKAQMGLYWLSWLQSRMLLDLGWSGAQMTYRKSPPPLFWHYHCWVGIILRRALSILAKTTTGSSVFISDHLSNLFSRIPGKILGLPLIGSTVVKCLPMNLIIAARQMDWTHWWSVVHVPVPWSPKGEVGSFKSQDLGWERDIFPNENWDYQKKRAWMWAHEINNALKIPPNSWWQSMKKILWIQAPQCFY